MTNVSRGWRLVKALEYAPISVRLRDDPPRRNPKRGTGGEAVPVEPNRPNNLSGGAAAALEFDD